MSYFFKMAVSACLVLCGLAMAVAVFHGCGKKAPPVAPSQAPLIGVVDLQGKMDQGKVRLTWSHSSENTKAAGYIILRAQSALSKPDCQDCPKVFQKVGKVSTSRLLRNQRHTLEFYQDLSEGFRYTFNVQPYQSSEGQGPDSNPVIIIHPNTDG